MPLYQTALGDQAVLSRHAADDLRTGGWLPTGAIEQTVQDRLASATALAPTSGTLYLFGGGVIPGGRAVSSISFHAGTAASVPLNQWFCLVDQSLNVLATTVDDTTTAWGATNPKTLLLATALGGATPGGTYTPASATPVYFGVCQVATTPATLRIATSNSAMTGQVPILAASSSTLLTTPASLGATAGALTGINQLAWAYCS